MRGYIREYRAGKFSYTVDVGKIDGKRKRLEKGGFTSKQAAEDALAVKLAELATTGEIFKPSDMNVDQLYEDFIQAASIVRRPATLTKYKSIYKHHIKDKLGYMYIKSIKAKNINEFISDMIKQGYSESFIKSTFNNLVAMFSYAVDHDYIKASPTDKATVPKVTRPKVEVFTKDEISKLYKLLENSACLIPFVIGLNTGARVGEVTGLRWRNIDFTNLTITIDHQLLAEKSRYCLGDTKTASGNRVIKMSPYLADFLKEQKRLQKYYREELGEFYKVNKVYNYFSKQVEIIDDFVCRKNNGEYITPNSVKYINRVARPAGINFYFHKLRHTHATYLLEHGASIKLVQERLGHARPDITLNIYSHLTPNHEAEIIENMVL